MDLPSREEYPDYYTTITNPISLNLILSNVDANKYATPADLQTDLDIMFENAKKYNQEGSAVYADAEELQRAARKLIKPPTIIVATAAAPPTPPVVIPEIPTDPGVEVSSFTREGTEYRIGDYVYTTPTAASGLASVAQIHAITLHDNGEHTFHGLWFWYPEQTVHRANQKFYENEVVKSQRTEVYHEAELRGKCMVLYFKEYPKYKSLDFDGKDVYICEFRYHEAGKNLHRIKDWPGTFPRGIKSIEELGYKFEELNPPLKVERTVVIHHADGGGGAGAAAGDEEGGSGDDEEVGSSGEVRSTFGQCQRDRPTDGSR